MRSLHRLLTAAAVLSLAAGCGTASTPAGSGSGGTPADAGSTGGVDAGAGAGGTPDAGSTGTPDAGSTGGGGADDGGTGGGATDAGTGGGTGGGTDGGTTASDCDGLAPGALPAMVTVVNDYSSASDGAFCGLPLGDGTGHVALRTINGFHPSWLVYDSAGRRTGGFGAWQGQYWPNPSGWVGYGGSSTQQMVVVNGYDSTGVMQTGTTPVNGSAAFARDPRGGLLAVGYFNYSSDPRPPPPHQMVMMFNANGTVRWGPDVLISDATVFGAGVDLLGHSLIILDGGSGNVDALWLDENGGSPHSGTPTPPFRLITGFAAGPSTWFETSPLIGGGLAVRRMDVNPSSGGGDERRTSQWLLVVPSLSSASQDAPDWLRQRPNTDMQTALSGRAYAFLSWAADASTCDQQAEVLSPTGNSCGRQDFLVDASSCRTRDLRLSLDGTVMQMLPASRELNRPLGTVVYTCTLRYWPGALR